MLIVLGLASLAAPASADAGTYGCTVLAGTELTSPTGGPLAASATSPAGGLGECKMHTTDTRSEVTSIDVIDGCHVFADTDNDLFMEGKVEEGDVYNARTSFIAFCDAGVVMADNGLSLADI